MIVIVGPTSVGKTALAIALAQRLRTEIISADSRQIYREMKIGTAKPTAAELQEVKHHFIDTHSIEEEYDAGQYGRDALALIHQLFENHDNLIVCGGSGLYIKAITDGFDEMPEIPEGVRESIIQDFQTYGLSWLQQKVKEIDPTYYEIVDQKNPHRLIRALEIHQASGRSVLDWRKKSKLVHPFTIIKIGLKVEREELYQRIDSRMDHMIHSGLFQEAEQLFSKRSLQALQTVGYQEIFDYLEGQYDREETIRLLKRNSRRYAKRQMTWFNRDEEIRWFHPNQLEEIYNFVDRFHE